MLGAAGLSASAAIRRLSNLLEWLDLRSNRTLHFFANNILMWDVFFVRRIEAWRQKAGPHIESWFEAAGGIEALASLANLAFNNPAWAFPRVADDSAFKDGLVVADVAETGPRFRAASLGHPLIPAAERVTNDFEMDGGTIAVVTGPNMAGKSTFLRTIGVNAVLAFAGGPVCAAGLEIAPFRLAAGLKSTDSLDRRMSLFYAELERLKMILDAIRDHPATFFIIDEMLKGTNEMDRHKGAMALMRQLIARRATGIVATHDLELTGLAAESPAVRNYHFDGDVVDDKLMFDFKLRPGICESFNALRLMKRIGIEV
jgi:DNA mismatch repair ATPase MutS